MLCTLTKNALIALRGTPGARLRIEAGIDAEGPRQPWIRFVDNGPGIVRKQVENVFGRLLFGSKFHRLKMSRGQQGIGISAAGMYGLITTGKPMVIHTLTDPKKMAHHIELAMNTKTNRAEVTVDQVTKEFPPHRLKQINGGTRDPGFLNKEDYITGTSVSIELEGRYQKGRGSVDEFLELCAIANPHARITFVPPSRVSAEETDDEPLGDAKKDAVHAEELSEKAAHVSPETEDVTAPAGIDTTITTIEKDGVIFFPRGTDQMPPETSEIQPHPKGIELGILIQMMRDFEAENRGGGTLYNFLQEQFSRVSPATGSPPSTNAIEKRPPSRSISSSSRRESAFTTETPTPCRPPEIL